HADRVPCDDAADHGSHPILYGTSVAISTGSSTSPPAMLVPACECVTDTVPACSRTSPSGEPSARAATCNVSVTSSAGISVNPAVNFTSRFRPYRDVQPVSGSNSTPAGSTSVPSIFADAMDLIC